LGNCWQLDWQQKSSSFLYHWYIGLVYLRKQGCQIVYFITCISSLIPTGYRVRMFCNRASTPFVHFFLTLRYLLPIHCSASNMNNPFLLLLLDYVTTLHSRSPHRFNTSCTEHPLCHHSREVSLLLLSATLITQYALPAHPQYVRPQHKCLRRIMDP
jgi:hypothetical protein